MKEKVEKTLEKIRAGLRTGGGEVELVDAVHEIESVEAGTAPGQGWKPDRARRVG